MGIRFYCPNGHKLHVKEFQAGRRGVCPYCGVDVDIPLTSTRESSKGKSAHKRTDEEEVNLNAIAPNAAPDALSSVNYNHAVTEPAEGASFTSARQDREIELSAPLERPVVIPEPAPAASAPKTDPFAEAPKALWYVRPAAGGQYGPATAEIMKTWLDEGRVSDDSMVWREGWDNWKNAADVFEQITPNKIDLHLSGVINKQKLKTETSSRSKHSAPAQGVQNPVQTDENAFRGQNSSAAADAVPAIPGTKPSFWKDYKLLAVIGEGLVIIGLIIALVLK